MNVLRGRGVSGHEQSAREFAGMIHILLIEDNPGDVLMIREALRTCDIAADVVIAFDGEEGLRLLGDERVPIDLVLLDLNLPKFGGLDVLERTRKMGRPPVIIFSGSDKESDRHRALELGALEFVTKPPQFGEFCRAIHAILRRWKARASGA
jgi:DNA-binding response OmpR family regulator